MTVEYDRPRITGSCTIKATSVAPMTKTSSDTQSAPTPPSVSDAAIKAVSANAARHLLEADLHYKAQRFPSAAASAVLSIEEAGKLNFLTIQGRTPKRRRHASHAMLFVSLLKAFGSWRWVAEWTKILRGEAAPAELELTEQQQMDIAEHPELERFVHRIQTGELADSADRLRAWAEAASAKEQRDGTYKTWERLFTDGLQHIRLYATYVDVTESGEVKREPAAIDDDFARLLCTGAAAFLALAILLAAQGRTCIELRGLFRDFPDDLTGWVVLKGALAKILPSLNPLPSLQSLVAAADESLRAFQKSNVSPACTPPE